MSSDLVPDFVCSTCYEPLNVHTADFGAEERVFVHSRPTPYDHQPAPIPRTQAPKVVQYCDFCSGTEVVWIYRTREQIHTIIAAPTYTSREQRRQVAKHWDVVEEEQGDAVDLYENVMSTGWAACRQCAVFVELRDVERLITHLRRLNPDTFAQHSRRLLRDHFAPFFRSIAGREPVTTPRPDSE